MKSEIGLESERRRQATETEDMAQLPTVQKDGDDVRERERAKEMVEFVRRRSGGGTVWHVCLLSVFSSVHISSCRSSVALC